MSIARAFTLRHKRNADSPPSPPPPVQHGAPSLPPGRAGTVKRMASIIDRNKISAPIELISTTNMLSYNAPDVSTIRQIRQTSSSTSSTSSTSGDDSDGSSPVRSSSELTDASSVDSSPISPEPNHLSCYFNAAQEQEHKQNPHKQPRRSSSTANFHRKTMSYDAAAPAIPQRALSHSKSSHIQLARKRSMQSISSTQSQYSNSQSQSHNTSNSMSVRSLHSNNASSHNHSVSGSSSIKEQRASADFFKSNVEQNHPFGGVMEQLNEVAEELGGTIRDAEAQEDVSAMREKGLMKWSVDDYLMELRPLYHGGFSARNHPATVQPAWI